MAISSGKLTNTKLGTAKVTVDILPAGRCIPGDSMSPTYITIHDTGNDAPAKNQHNYLKNNNKSSGTNAKASWHFSVDDTEIIQAVATNKKAWHAGHATGNSKSIGIEISQRSTGDKQKQAYKNAIELVKVLMNAYNIPISRVVRHKDWTGKDCPYNMNHNKFGYDWNWFKAEITKKEEIQEEYDMDKLVVYNSDADMASAAILADYHQCGMEKKSYFEKNKTKAKTVYYVGGKAGTDRFDTFKEVANMLK